MLPRLRHHHDHHHDHDHEHGHSHHMRMVTATAATTAPSPTSCIRISMAKARARICRRLAEAFIDGFRQAEDKTSYLRLAGVPDAIDGPDGLARRLVDVTVTDGFQVATASPGFGSRELVYLPYPGGWCGRARN